MEMVQPKHVILVSGKRKCGKDHLSNILAKRLGERCQIIHISEPIKTAWAKKLNLDLQELLGDGPYKEQYRKDMISWSEEMRAQDSGYFCRLAMEKAQCEIIIVSDIRRKTDIKYFRQNYGKRCMTLRLTCPEMVRAERGWIYTQGIDDVPSECDLDDYEQWDLVLENNGQMDGEQLVNLILTKFQF